MKRILTLISVIMLSVGYCSLGLGTEQKKAEKPKPKKTTVVKIKNTGKILSEKEIQQLDPDTFKEIQILNDTLLITLREKKKK